MRLVVPFLTVQLLCFQCFAQENSSSHSAASIRRGKVLFSQRACASCHTPGSKDSMGPDLLHPEQPLAHDQLLEAIQDPSKTIKKGYETSVVLLATGEVLTGRVVSQTDNSVVLLSQRNLTSERRELNKDEIEDIAEQSISAMPKGLLEGMNQQQVDDLLAYLTAIGDPNYTEPRSATIPAKMPGIAQEPVEGDSSFFSPEESMKGIQLAPGYQLELVASEPMIEEPVLCVWDGNSRMYVAEMRTYMQDAEGTDQDLPKSRVTLLEDTDNDGKMDKYSRFIEELVLPRMILPLDDRIIVNETYTQDYYSYRDTNGDGVADEKVLLYGGGKSGGNLEHQNSGMTWGIDNYIYTAQTGGTRHRFVNGEWKTDRIYGDSGQWGLAMDDLGRFFLSAAGAEKPAYGFQQLPQYGKMSLPGELEPGFERVFPIVKMDDVQGGRGRVHPETQTLTLFTGCGGQSVYRGGQMPADFSGDYILPEPVGRLVRRAKVTLIDGKAVLSNAYENSEFIASTDKNFRPVWSATGPDGCLYIVDMYRGIIQEGNWTRKGSYLRERIDEQGFAKNIGRGRIYRVVHDSTERGELPKLLDRTTNELIEELSHPNGWRRDTAQKLIVLRHDDSAIPALVELAKSGESPLGRMHALWTLDGLDAVTAELISKCLIDPDGRVQQAAIRISEPRLATSPDLVHQVANAGFQGDVSVTVQAINSLRFANSDKSRELITELAAAYPANDLILSSSQTSLRYRDGDRGPTFANFDAQTLEQMKRGYDAYTLVCIRCHGPDGKGAIASAGLQSAPSLGGSPRVLASPELPSRILLHGLIGPIEGKTYPGLMESMKREDDEWIASALTYVRNSFGNSAPSVKSSDVARARKETANRSEPFRIEDLAEYLPISREVMSSWTFTANFNPEKVRNAVDGKPETRYDTGKFQGPGQWFQFDMKAEYQLTSLLIDSSSSPNDYPREYLVRFSDDAMSWSEPVATGQGDNKGQTSIRLDSATPTRFVWITQLGTANSNYWSIHELTVFGRPLLQTNTSKELTQSPFPLKTEAPISVLLIDGQNNHDWAATTPVMKNVIEYSGLFHVEVSTTSPSGNDLSTFQPDFSRFDVVLLNYNGGAWPTKTQAAFVDYVRNGGGVVVVHAANNAFAGWSSYNEMIGIGWRDAKFGTSIAVNDSTGDLVRIPAGQGPGAGHGSFHSYVVKARETNHPIMQGLPVEWRHARDELYHGMRGPVGNLEILATAFSSKESGGTGQHEPVVMTNSMGRGRIFHTSLGHSVESMTDVGFQTLLLRGTEWAATGNVTIPAPPAEDLPIEEVRNLTLAELWQYKQGNLLYLDSCSRCHGQNGLGRFDGTGQPLAPALTASNPFLRSSDALIRVILRGLDLEASKDICPGFVVDKESPENVSAIASYMRNSFAENLTSIDADQVRMIERQLPPEQKIITSGDLDGLLPVSRNQTENWSLTASDGAKDLPKCIDGDIRSRYTTGKSMEPAMWIAFDMKQPRSIQKIVLDTRPSPNDYPRGYSVSFSEDGQNWMAPIASGISSSATTEIRIPKHDPIRHVMIKQTGTAGSYWSIHELEVYDALDKSE